MALTSVTISRSTQLPALVGKLAATANNALGFTFQTVDGTGPSKVVTLVGDADWFWCQADGQTADTAHMVRVRTDQPYRIQVNEQPYSIYIKTATGTSNIVAIQEL